MIHLITGGSGSGKSAYAEEQICKYHKSSAEAALYYIATMKPYGEESKQKIRRHRTMREGKGFKTIECYTGLKETADTLAAKGRSSCILLECMSNLVANELYEESGAKADTVETVIAGLGRLQKICQTLVIVTNEVFSESADLTKEMAEYKHILGMINQKAAGMAEKVTEVVYGIPIEIKGGTGG